MNVNLMVFIQEIIYEAYVMNPHEYKSIGTHWIAVYVNANDIVYFNTFPVDHIAEGTKKFIENKNKTSIEYKHSIR